MPDPDVWEYREPAHPQTEATAARWQGEQYRQDEHLSRINGPQVDAPRQQPPGYEQTGQLQAAPPQYTPPRQVSWVSAHKGLTAVYSLCAAAVIGAGVFALATSGPGSPGTPPLAAAAAGGSRSSPASHQQPGVIAATQPAGSTVTGTAATARAGAKVTAVPGAAAAPPAATRAPGSSPAASASTTLGTTPVSVTYSNTTAVATTPTPPPTPPPPTCTVTSGIPEVQGAVSQAVPAGGTESFDVSEYGPATPAGTAGALVAQVVISVPGPLTAGQVVTGEGAANASAYSCAVTSVSVSGN